MTSVALNGTALDRAVLTHGFGGGWSEEDLEVRAGRISSTNEAGTMSEYGADLLRLWVSSAAVDTYVFPFPEEIFTAPLRRLPPDPVHSAHPAREPAGLRCGDPLAPAGRRPSVDLAGSWPVSSAAPTCREAYEALEFHRAQPHDQPVLRG